jgi:hypothetical protein
MGVRGIMIVILVPVHPQTLVMETLVLVETKVDVVGVVEHQTIVEEPLAVAVTKIHAAM